MQNWGLGSIYPCFNGEAYVSIGGEISISKIYVIQSLRDEDIKSGDEERDTPDP